MDRSMPVNATALLKAWSQGDHEALNELIPLVHQELRRLARGYMTGERAGHLLQTTALVHEAYLRLVDCQQVRWQDRMHFLAVSAQLMRRILVDDARSRNYLKRGAGRRPVSLEEEMACGLETDLDFVALDDALHDLAAFDPRKSKVVELKFFGGLNTDEIAGVLQVSPQTVLRDWKLAKSWLVRHMKRESGNER
jgi:RNA polymerase sigma-70 factor (ECF subfamily)